MSSTNSKTCKTCAEPLGSDQFYRSKGASDGLSSSCKECSRAAAKRRRQENPEYYTEWKERNPDYHKEWKRRDRELKRTQKFKARPILMQVLLMNPCVDCGENDPLVLEFDHLRDKHHNVGAMFKKCKYWRIDLWHEIDKCEVVCANCHKRRTAKQCNSWRLQWLDG